ncbi:hypothetical protein [Chryseobacterium oryctis]|uniref:hypothetical protein n=1 Tax=Chryseobacterium oryctis TaxID=2952618 RepID=UPI0022281EE7|nr:hypothetical protein [Chryseobacterium oryctis]
MNEKWYYPIILMIIGFVLSYFLLQIPKELAFNTSIIIVYVSIIFALIFSIIRLFKKDYLKGIFQTILTLLISVVYAGYFSFFLLFYPYDFFADNLKIPQNIKFEKPINLNENLSSELKIPNINTPTFLLYDGFQPGIYQYEIFINKIEKGTAYLKVYEITKNEKLSEKDIEEKSKINIYNPTNKLMKFKLKDDFTVYEGDWNQFYGSRIEVWFKPENKSEKERKLFSKNYIIQGWQR